MLKIFKDKRLAYVAAGVSLLLQLISFLTTYQGAEYYFKGIFILAPVFFAVAVQLVVYFLENSVRGKKSAAKILALVLAMCCSSYFSYIGIYNNVNSPLTYYQEKYTNTRNTLQTKYDSLISKTDKKAQQKLNEIISELSAVMIGFDTKKEELDTVKKELNSVSSVSVNNISAPDKKSFDSYEEYAAAYEAYVKSTANSSAAKINKDTKSILKQYGYSGRQEVVSELASIKGNIKNSRQSIKKICKMLNISYKGKVSADLENIRANLTEHILNGDNDKNILQSVYKIVSLRNQYITKNNVNADIINQCIELHASHKESLMAEYSEVSDKEPSVCKSNLQWEISKAVTEINRIYTVLESDKQLDMQQYMLEDVYVLPLIRIAQKETRKMAVICLTIALLTDLLSLLFAMMFCTDKEILSLKNVDELLSREESLFEKNIAAALELSMRHKGNDEIQITGEFDDKCKKRLADFLGNFETSSFALDSGYSLQTSLAKLKEYQALTAFLCQLDLACILSEEEYKEQFEQGNGDTIVLLKTRFFLWCNEQWGIREGAYV